MKKMVDFHSWMLWSSKITVNPTARTTTSASTQRFTGSRHSLDAIWSGNLSLLSDTRSISSDASPKEQSGYVHKTNFIRNWPKLRKSSEVMAIRAGRQLLLIERFGKWCSRGSGWLKDQSRAQSMCVYHGKAMAYQNAWRWRYAIPRTRHTRSARPGSFSPPSQCFQNAARTFSPPTNNLTWFISSRANVDVSMWGRPHSAWKHEPNNMCRHRFWGPPRRTKTTTRMKTKMERSPRRSPKPSPAPSPLASTCLTMWNAWKVTTCPCSKLSAVLDVSPFCTSWSRYTSSLWNLICVNSCSSSALSPCFQVNKISLLILVIIVEPNMHAHKTTRYYLSLSFHTPHTTVCWNCPRYWYHHVLHRF